MVAAQEVIGRVQQAGSAAGPRPGIPVTLADEHAVLLAQVAVRADDVVAAIADGRWPARELQGLAGYLRAEVLRQAGDEEWLLFPASHPAPGFARLERDHDRLRAGTEVLEQAAGGTGLHSRAQVAAVARDVLAQLELHLAREEQVLAAADAPDQVPATTEPGSRQHGWYPLTEGPVIDLEALPPGEKTDAAAARIMRLHAGEQVELRSASDPAPVWRRVDQLSPGGYGFAYLQDGPAQWRIQVTRRPTT
ncbi:MAG: hemerythrin domain-containing protein [Streptosporangiaceae bacterium]